MAEYRRFTDRDYDVYAGAEVFADGSKPFIFERAFEDNKDAGLCIVIDKNGIQIQLFGGEPDEEDNVWLKDVSLTALRAEGYMMKLVAYTNKYTYAPTLAYALDHPDAEIVEGFEFC